MPVGCKEYFIRLAGGKKKFFLLFMNSNSTGARDLQGRPSSELVFGVCCVAL